MPYEIEAFLTAYKGKLICVACLCAGDRWDEAAGLSLDVVA